MTKKSVTVIRKLLERLPNHVDVSVVFRVLLLFDPPRIVDLWLI